MRYMVVIEKGSSNHGAFVPDLPGCIAVGKTEAEALALIEEAIQFHLKSDSIHRSPPTHILPFGKIIAFIKMTTENFTKPY